MHLMPLPWLARSDSHRTASKTTRRPESRHSRRHKTNSCNMSLTRFLDMAEVKGSVKTLRPKLPRKINAPLKVAPRSNRYMMVGTAFDYLLRFELQRRAPHAISECLVAEDASEMICGPGWFMHLSP